MLFITEIILINAIAFVFDAANVNIELKNGKILWRVPASKLEELAEDVKEWMPIPPRL